MKFSINDFLSKYDQICWELQIWSHLLKNFLRKNFIFYAMQKEKAKIKHSNDVTMLVIFTE